MKRFLLTFIFLLSGIIYAQNTESLIISGHSQKNGLIEYYPNGLLKKFSYGEVSLSCSVTKQSETSLVAKIQWDIYDSLYESILNIQISPENIKFNSVFVMPNNEKKEKDIKISGNKFMNSDFTVDLSFDSFNYKRDKQDWIIRNSTIYDKNSFGKTDSGVFVRPIARVNSNSKNVCIGRYNCYESNSGGFTYVCDENIYYTPSFDKNSIPYVMKFLNFYLVSAELDPSVLPFLLLFSEFESYEKINTIVSYDATSFLIENNSIYSADNLNRITGLPWASSNGYGIGDVLSITVDINADLFLEFRNGFQSEKKYLYEQNSRIKKIEIINIDTNQKLVFDLKDSPKAQSVLIQKNPKKNNQVGRFKIKILEVYPGTKYKDLCLQSLLAE